MPISNNTFRGVYTPPAKVMKPGALNNMLTDPANKVTGDSVAPRLSQSEAPSASPLPLLIPGLMVACLIGSWVLFSTKPSFAFSFSTSTPAPESALLAAPTNPPQKSRQDIPAPTATIEPTITPTSGPNYAATQIVLDTEQRRIDLENQAIALQNAQVESEKKAALAQIEIEEANKKAEIAIQAAKDKANADIAAKNEIIGSEIKAVSDEIAAKKRKAEADYTWSIVLSALGAFALVVFAVGSFFVLRQQYTKILEESAAIKAMRSETSAPAIPFVPAPPVAAQGIVENDYADDFEGIGVKRAEAFWFLKNSADGSLMAQHGTGDTRARQVIQAMTDWCVKMEYAKPGRGNKAAQWAMGHSNGDVARAHGFMLNTNMTTATHKNPTPPPAL